MSETSLTVGDKALLVEHERTIELGLRSFVDVGRALWDIKTRHLYIECDATFEGYCKKRFGFAKSRAYQLIDAAKVVDTVSTIVETKPGNEAQARELAAVAEERQAEVWQQAVETAPKNEAGEPVVTAAHVRKVAVRLERSPAPSEQSQPRQPAKCDALGTELPKKMHAAFARAGEFEAVNRDLTAIAKRLEALAGDGVGVFLHMQTIEADLGNVKRAVKFAKPYAVCGYCQGKGCKACKTVGWVPKNIFESTPEAK